MGMDGEATVGLLWKEPRHYASSVLFFGIKQPLRIKGEGPREPLAVLLERMTTNDVAR